MINNISVLICPVGEPGPIPKGLNVDSDQSIDAFCGVMIENGQIRSLTEEELEELEELKNLSKSKEV